MAGTGTIVQLIQLFYCVLRMVEPMKAFIDNPYFEGMVNQIYPSEFQLNKANTSDTEALFWIYVCLFLTALFHPKFMINVMNLILTIVNFPFLYLNQVLIVHFSNSVF